MNYNKLTLQNMKAVLHLKPIKTVALALCLLTLFMLCGCLPIPHSKPRSAEIYGRVLDAKTHLPIKGAKVSLTEKPHHTTYTDSQGHFHMKATKNHYFAYVAPDGDWPNSKTGLTQIECPGYIPYSYDGYGYGGGNLGDINLEPERK